MGGTYIRNFICNFISHRKKEEKMKLKKRNVFIGITSFLIVLFTMPLGHALMILMEHLMEPVTMHYATFFMGLIGLIMVITGVFAKGDTQQTLWGLFGGLLFWTGWIEFIYVYYAHRFGVQPLIVDGEVVTKPEYLIMPSSFGFWIMFMLLYLFNIKSGCDFFNYLQRVFFRNSKVQVLPDLLFLQISNRRNTHHQNCSQYNGKTTVYKYVAYSQRVSYKACDKQTDNRREQTYTVEKQRIHVPDKSA